LIFGRKILEMILEYIDILIIVVTFLIEILLLLIVIILCIIVIILYTYDLFIVLIGSLLLQLLFLLNLIV